MFNILLVFTGGTIGSVISDSTINTCSNQHYQLLELFDEAYSDHQGIEFKIIQPIQLLSENIVPSVWESIISAVEAENIEQYDGIIITHGTDTLAFTAAALALYFNSIKVPLLMVSSNYPLNHPQANGLNNFICAIELIKQRQDAGVFVPYQNPGQEMVVHFGARLVSCLQLSGDFISVQFKHYLNFRDNNFTEQHSIPSLHPREIRLMPLFSSRILLIKPYPGLDYSHFKLDQVDAVIHDLYHSGTACSTIQWGDNHSLQTFIAKCQRNNIAFYMAPAIKTEHSYHSTLVLLDQGARMIWNMSLEAAYIKLLLAYGNYKDKQSRYLFLEQNIAHEMLTDHKV